ncbi:hypothetical protein Bbelb_200480 [Branchiostoma belcheri]|nr:hypothetical protein Bbelb_200480 [Branchiostoma belcheri]
MCATLQGRLESDSKYHANHTCQRITRWRIFSERTPPSGYDPERARRGLGPKPCPTRLIRWTQPGLSGLRDGHFLLDQRERRSETIDPKAYPTTGLPGKAYSYFDSKWIKKVHYHAIAPDSNMCFLKTTCTPSQSIKNIHHDLWAAVEKKTGRICGAYCSCFAGDVQKMELFLEAMKLPYMITVAMSSEKKPTSGQVLPILHKLEQHLLDKDEDDNFTKQIKSSIRDDLSTRYREQDRLEFLEEASALDPRFKNSTGFPSDVIGHTLVAISSTQAILFGGLELHANTALAEVTFTTIGSEAIPLIHIHGVIYHVNKQRRRQPPKGLAAEGGQKDLDTCDNNSTRMDDTATELLQNLEQPEEDARDEEGLDAAAALPTKEVTIKDAMPCIETLKDLCRTKDYEDMLQLIMTFETNPNKKAMEQTVAE